MAARSCVSTEGRSTLLQGLCGFGFGEQLHAMMSVDAILSMMKTIVSSQSTAVRKKPFNIELYPLN
jgi:hypothetical protein